MTEQNTVSENTTTEAVTTEQKIDGRTKRALDTAIAKKQVSQESYRAVLEGRIDLKAAKDLGREGSPYGPTVRVDKNNRSRPCLCQCGETTSGSLFRQGHDMRVFRLLREHLTEGRELPSEVLEYAEQSGKLERANRKVSEEDQRRAEKEANKKPKK